jgi:anti-sigma-K factor RskA
MTEQPTGSHEVWDELAAGHALHALEPGDEQRFTAHLAGCARCQAVLQDYSLVAAQLGSLADTEPTSPPDWQTVRQGVITESDAVVTTLEDRRRRRASRLVAAAAALVTVAGGVAVAWQTTRGSDRTRPAAALAACEHQAGCRAIRLHTPDGSSPAAVIVTDNRVAVVPLAMAGVAPGRTYVLWQMPRDGGPIPVTEFRDISRESASTRLSASYRDTAAFAISIESAAVPLSRPTRVLAVGTAT